MSMVRILYLNKVYMLPTIRYAHLVPMIRLILLGQEIVFSIACSIWVLLEN